MPSNARVISVASLFAALALILNFSEFFRVPAPYAPFLIYEIWEIPIVAAFLLFGARAGIFVVVVNYLILQLRPGVLPIGPVFNLVAILSMVLGIYVSYRVIITRLKIRSQKIGVVLSTAFGSFFRVITMSVMNYLLLPLPFPFGFSIPVSAMTATLILIAVFNVTVALYTIPLGHTLSNVVSYRVSNRQTWTSFQVSQKH